jgi:hypothetical protein
MRAVILIPMLALASCAASSARSPDADRAEIAKELAGKTAGEPRSCIPLDDARSAKAYHDALVYRTSRRLIYVNAARGCDSFDPDPIFVNKVFGSQLCRGDVIQLVSRTGGIPGPFCILGDFTPYRSK